jgi:transcription initiation factor TFIID subunit 10
MGVAGAPVVAGAAGAAGGTAGGKEAAGKAAQNLGVQRPGYGGGGQGGSGQGRTVLTMEDLGMAVGEYGVNVKRGEFYR